MWQWMQQQKKIEKIYNDNYCRIQWLGLGFHLESVQDYINFYNRMLFGDEDDELWDVVAKLTHFYIGKN